MRSPSFTEIVDQLAARIGRHAVGPALPGAPYFRPKRPAGARFRKPAGMKRGSFRGRSWRRRGR